MPQAKRFDQFMQPLKVEKSKHLISAEGIYPVYIHRFPFLYLFGLPLRPRSAAAGGASSALISIGFYFIGHNANSFRKLFKRSDS